MVFLLWFRNEVKKSDRHFFQDKPVYIEISKRLCLLSVFSFFILFIVVKVK